MSHSKFKKASLLAGTALVAAGVMTAGTASADGHAKVVNSGNDKTAMKISGHMSRQITYMDDGTERIRHSDSDFSSSRVLFDAAGKVNKDLKIASRFEVAFDDARNSPAAAASENDGRSGNDVRTRKAEIYLTHSSLGKVSIGAGSTAADNVTETAWTPFFFLAGAVGSANGGAFRVTSANGSDLGETLGDVMGQTDMLGRSTRIRYDTPNIAGFVASTSHQDDQSYDVALRYAGKAMDTKIKASFGYAVDDSNDGNEHVGGGIGFQHSSGIGVSYGFEHINDTSLDDTQINDPFFQHGQLSYTAKLNDMGRSMFIYEYAHHENKVRTTNDTATAHSVGFSQNIDAAASEVGLRYTHAELDRDGTTFLNDDIDSVSLHLRVKF